MESGKVFGCLDRPIEIVLSSEGGNLTSSWIKQGNEILSLVSLFEKLLRVKKNAFLPLAWII
jgi:hypothetical protein